MKIRADSRRPIPSLLRTIRHPRARPEQSDITRIFASTSHIQGVLLHPRRFTRTLSPVRRPSRTPSRFAVDSDRFHLSPPAASTPLSFPRPPLSVSRLSQVPSHPEPRRLELVDLCPLGSVRAPTGRRRPSILRFDPWR
jgi:hypothetical protein